MATGDSRLERLDPIYKGCPQLGRTSHPSYRNGNKEHCSFRANLAMPGHLDQSDLKTLLSVSCSEKWNKMFFLMPWPISKLGRISSPFLAVSRV